jgi:transcriptional regulator with XRE-family HTH domain
MLLQPGEEFYSQLLQQLRAEQCMSQRRLAELTGINRTVLRKFELGTGRLDVRNYARVLVPLGHNLEVVTEATYWSGSVDKPRLKLIRACAANSQQESCWR